MNKQLLLNKRPSGVPEKDTWRIEQNAIGKPQDGEFLVKQLYFSLDPAMRGWINDTRSYIPPVQLGEVMRAGSVGQVMSSRNPKFKAGDFVMGMGGIQEYAVTDGKGWHKVDPKLAPLPLYLSTLGMTGMTAYFGILEVGQIKEGETVLVSGAAGAVGSVVGQIAKIKGCRVVGIAGGPTKCQYLKDELGFDGVIDYKNEDLKTALKRECPKGIDVYFDNVGGEMLDMALAFLRFKGRVAICGAISQYNSKKVHAPANYLSLLVNRGRMEGFIVFDYAKDYKTAAMQMGQWMQEGKLKSKEDIYEGIDNFYEVFMRLFSGEKMGKLVLKA